MSPSITAASAALVSLAALLFACADEPPTLEPILVVPAAGSEADPYRDIEVFEFSIAYAGDDDNLALITAASDEPLVLTGLPFGDNLVAHLRGLTSSADVSYGRTCPFDFNSGLARSTPQLYFSRLVRWGQSAPPFAPNRVGGVAYSMPDGRAVFMGGNRDLIEVFDPIDTALFSRLERGVSVRDGAVVATFSSGQAVVVGGRDGDGESPIETIALVDPAASSVEQQLILNGDGPTLVGHAAARLVGDSTQLVDEAILVTGGECAGEVCGDGEYERGESVDSALLLWIDSDEGRLLSQWLDESMVVARREHTMTRLGDDLGADVLIIGGRGQDGQPVAVGELYRPLRGRFELLDRAILTWPRWGHQAVRMQGDAVLVLGGVGSDGRPVPELELFDPLQGRFDHVETLPEGAGLTDFSVTPLPDGRLLMAGGRDSNGEPVDTVNIVRIDAVSNGEVQVLSSDRMSTPRAGHSAVLLCDGTVLLAGGTEIPASPSERYNPPARGRR
ncbi:MAG: hypothetical protein Tsb0020_43860 [Haliangiales bacterium]